MKYNLPHFYVETSQKKKILKNILLRADEDNVAKRVNFLYEGSRTKQRLSWQSADLMSLAFDEDI